MVTRKLPRGTRDRLLKRCHGYCEVGGEPLGAADTWAVHHRRLRSQGGGHNLANLMAVCHEHHNLATASVHGKVAKAQSHGWLVASNANPARVLVKVFGAYWALLTDDGRYDQASPGLLERLHNEEETTYGRG